MAKAKGKTAPKAEQQEVVAAEQAAPAKSRRLRLPLPEAKAHNGQFSPVANGDTVAGANVALTAKGTNPKKVRVYGYDNLANGGGVPKAASIAVVSGAECPKGVNSAQWEKLVGFAGQTVQAAYDGGVASRTVRRAYRAGVIRFAA